MACSRVEFACFIGGKEKNSTQILLANTGNNIASSDP
jgi:hypothetical protein